MREGEKGEKGELIALWLTIESDAQVNNIWASICNAIVEQERKTVRESLWEEKRESEKHQSEKGQHWRKRACSKTVRKF